MDELLAQLKHISAAMATLADRVERYDADLREFSERFEEVLTRLENERRLDWNTGD